MKPKLEGGQYARNGGQYHRNIQWELEVEKRINEINGKVDVTEIDLDLRNNEKKALDPDFIMRPDTSNGYFFGEIKGITALNDSLYLLDQTQKTVFVLDMEANVQRRVGNEGRGPGEFLTPSNIATNGEYILSL